MGNGKTAVASSGKPSNQAAEEDFTPPWMQDTDSSIPFFLATAAPVEGDIDEALCKALEAGAKATACSDVLTYDTVLHAASHANNIVVVQLLLQRKADIDGRNRHGDTPLLAAVAGGSLDVVRFLLEASCDIHKKSAGKQCMTALGLAKSAKQQRFIDLLSRHGARDDTDFPLQPVTVSC